VTPEVTRQVCLVVEADLRGHLRGRHTIEQPPPSSIDPAADHVPVRRDPVRAREAADGVGR
jgi:hypothetical protein